MASLNQKQAPRKMAGREWYSPGPAAPAANHSAIQNAQDGFNILQMN
jgi:hypothetical protein